MDEPTPDVSAVRSTFEDDLADSLISTKKINSQALARARRVAQEQAERLDVILCRLGLVAEEDMASAYSSILDIPLATAAEFPDTPILEGKLSPRFLKESRVIPLANSDGAITLAMADPLDDFARQAIGMIAGLPVHSVVAVPADVDAAFERLYGSGKGSMGELVDALGGKAEDGNQDDIERLRDQASEAPVVRLVNMLISRAVETRASDLHIEPLGTRLRVRFRIDGVLEEVESPPSNLQAAVISRVKIMANLNIAERRLPQDGRIRLAVRGKSIDLRVSTVPTMHGESVVMRVLDRSSVRLDFPALGFTDDQITTFRQALHQPNGILLVTGPTGSGKTTTLYASLTELNEPTKKILTVEDPVEYQLEGVNQIQVKPQIGLTFANILRSIVRQDPDIIMVGEIRDLETAQIAVQAALTGHLVLSTLHTNTAAATATRLLDMGVEDYLLTSTVNGIMAQRLVRALCSECREPYDVLPEMMASLGLRDRLGAPAQFYRAKGCDACNQTGYFGRTGILEILIMSDSVRRLVLQHAEAQDIQEAAVQAGMRTMYDDGIRKAAAGVTSVEEVLRVTRER